MSSRKGPATRRLSRWGKTLFARFRQATAQRCTATAQRNKPQYMQQQSHPHHSTAQGQAENPPWRPWPCCCHDGEIYTMPRPRRGLWALRPWIHIVELRLHQAMLMLMLASESCLVLILGTCPVRTITTTMYRVWSAGSVDSYAV